MSKTIVTNNPTPGVCKPGASADRIKAFDFKADAFDLKEDEPNRCVIIDTSTPIDRQREFTFIADKVKNVYANTSIPTEYQLGTTAGIRIINKVSDVLSITDSTDSTYRKDVPIEAHIVLTLPYCDLITSEIVYQQIMDAVATLFYAKQGSDGTYSATARVLKEARGIVKPPM